MTKEEMIKLATDLDDEWHCAGGGYGIKYWTDREKRSYIFRAVQLAEAVLEFTKQTKTEVKTDHETETKIR